MGDDNKMITLGLKEIIDPKILESYISSPAFSAIRFKMKEKGDWGISECL